MRSGCDREGRYLVSDFASLRLLGMWKLFFCSCELQVADRATGKQLIDRAQYL